jgi:rhamnose transport system permease protein
MANVTGIVMSMVIGVLLIASMVLPRLLKRRGAHA